MPLGGPGLRGAIDLVEAWVRPMGRLCGSYRIGRQVHWIKLGAARRISTGTAASLMSSVLSASIRR
jgi:hypothetical protein